MTAKELGQQLKQVRQDHFYSQAEIAVKLYMSTQGYSNIERGKSAPSVFYLFQLAELYDISLDELVGMNRVKEENNGKTVDDSSRDAGPCEVVEVP